MSDFSAANAPTITVDDVLSFPELRAGKAEIVAGRKGLSRTLRWAHVVAGQSAISLLEGGELVLTTGAGWPVTGPALDDLAAQLVASDPAGVILELGGQYDSAPPELIAACERAGIALAVLHGEVRFVQITQRVHQRVLAAQTEALEARAAVHAMLTELGLNRSPIDYVIERLAETIQAPVVLEDSAGRVVAWAGGGAGSAGSANPELVLRGFGEIAPAATTAATTTTATATATFTDNTDHVPVEAQGKRFGRLTALPGPAHPAGRRTVLELGAFALALGRLADPEGDQWLQLSSKQLFDTLLSGRFRRDAEVAAQLRAAGLPIDGRMLQGATLRGTGDFGAHESLERAVLETALRRAVAPEGRVILVPDPDDRSPNPALLALLSFAPGDPRVQIAQTPPLATRLAHELDMLLPSTTPRPWRAHLGLGAPGRGLRSLITSLERVRASGHLAPTAKTGRVTVQQAERQALAYLMRGLAALPEVQEFASDTLGPLIDHDEATGPGHSGDLITVLEAYLAHPTNRSLAAQNARLSRSVFYQRLALIEELLAVDLADGGTIATLAVALHARR
ncbi:PucR family transcriptional regulator [Leucobacter sp. HY1910]